MIDRTQLTEALRVQAWRTWTPEEWNTVVQAAQAWLDFPTDEQVEAAAKALCLYAMGEGVWERDVQDMWREQARAALEAVRQTMIGDNQPETRCEIDGSLAVAGACPTHGGDNCLHQTMIGDTDA